jgi:NADH-quinone oxidoreductase subunit C
MPDVPADRPALGEVQEAVTARFPDSVLAGTFEKGELTEVIRSGDLLPVLRFLKEEQGFNCLDDIVVLDNLRAPEPPSKRFSVLYQLYRFPGEVRVRLAVDIGEDEPLDSVVSIYRSADWAEREAFDMFGLRFRGHPDLRRVYLPDDFDGHPLCKDFPLGGKGDGL